MIIMNTGSRLSNMISSDSTSSDRSTITSQCASSFTLFGSDNDGKDQPQQHQTSCPLRSRTSSEVSWFSASDDEDDDGDDADIDLIPAIHKTINACLLYYGDDDQTSATSFSCSSSVSNSPTVSGLIRRQVSFDELALLQLKFADLSSSICTNSVRSSRTVQFSEDPPSVFSYERPEPQYHFLLYYDDDEMDEMMNDYVCERR